jgi:hypothetical protein
MSWDRYNCDKCGQLVCSGTPGAGWVFVPDADIPGMYEEDLMRCPRCVKKHGCPLPSQRVVVSKCCGINTPNSSRQTPTASGGSLDGVVGRSTGLEKGNANG